MNEGNEYTLNYEANFVKGGAEILKVETVFGLSDGNKGGNRAGICLIVKPLKDFVMQKIACSVGYAETAFIQIIDSHTVYIDFYTPLERVPLCGHATIASFQWLKDEGLITGGDYKLLTEDFKLSVIVDSNKIMMEQPKAHIGASVPFQEIAATLGIPSKNAHPFLEPQIVSTGIADILIGVDTVDTLKQINPNHLEIIELCKKVGAQGYHVFAPTDTSNRYYVRNFAPLLGIPEESATGTSNCALSAYLNFYGLGEESFTFKQGMWMDEPSEIITQLDLLNGTYWVGGSGRRDQTIPALHFDKDTGANVLGS